MFRNILFELIIKKKNTFKSPVSLASNNYLPGTTASVMFNLSHISIGTQWPICRTNPLECWHSHPTDSHTKEQSGVRSSHVASQVRQVVYTSFSLHRGSAGECGSTGFAQAL